MIACTVCPTCRRETNTDHISYHAKTINGTLNEITTWRCSECDIFFVERVEKISTVYLLSPVTTALSSPEIPTEDEARQDTDNFLNSLPVHACSKCGRGFHAENPFKIDGEVVCSDCLFDYNKMCKFNPDMPRGIDGDDECIKCPGCDMVYSNVDAVHDSELCPICRRREENTGNGTHPDPEQYYCQECGCIYSGARECPVCDGDA